MASMAFKHHFLLTVALMLHLMLIQVILLNSRVQPGIIYCCGDQLVVLENVEELPC
jgi:hypothetical protein